MASKDTHEKKELSKSSDEDSKNLSLPPRKNVSQEEKQLKDFVDKLINKLFKKYDIQNKTSWEIQEIMEKGFDILDFKKCTHYDQIGAVYHIFNMFKGKKEKDEAAAMNRFRAEAAFMTEIKNEEVVVLLEKLLRQKFNDFDPYLKKVIMYYLNQCATDKDPNLATYGRCMLSILNKK